jgi:hypothetical protein
MLFGYGQLCERLPFFIPTTSVPELLFNDRRDKLTRIYCIFIWLHDCRY